MPPEKDPAMADLTAEREPEIITSATRQSPSGDKEKAHDQSSLSSASVSGEESKGPLHPRNQSDLDAALARLSDDERQIVLQQIDSPTSQLNFFGLYRYASKGDLLVILISGICAIAGGAALPLFTVSDPHRSFPLSERGRFSDRG
jgi:ATP-binding cassette subfamily B (MDR/TAP) protein 1